MTVYSVPQGLAATVPVSVASSPIAVVVELLRVPMLGPVVLGAALLVTGRKDRRLRHASPRQDARGAVRTSTPIAMLVPWFLVGFVGLAACRSSGVIPGALVARTASAAHLLTVVSMAAPGLNVELRTSARCGDRTALVAAGSRAFVLFLSLLIVRESPLS